MGMERDNMPDTYHNKIDLGGVTVAVTVDGVLDITINDGIPATAYCTSAQFRQIALMLMEGADAADGLPARPVRIEDVDLQYEQNAHKGDSK